MLACVAAGCLHELEREAYVNRNRELFRELPRFPGAILVDEVSTSYRDGESGPVIGYGTRFDLELPGSTTPERVLAFYGERLQPRWRLVEALDGPVLNYRREDALVSINLESLQTRLLEVAVDHEYFGKLGRP